MEPNKKQLQQITALSDDEFKNKLNEALIAVGASDSVKARLTQNIPQLKRTLEALSEQDLALLAQSIDQAMPDAIKKSLSE